MRTHLQESVIRGIRGTCVILVRMDIRGQGKICALSVLMMMKNVGILLVICLSLMVILSIMVKSTINSALVPKKLHSIYLKIMANYMQIVLITMKFELDWPDEVLELFDV